MKTIKQSEIKELKERCIFWESEHKKMRDSSEYYQAELEKAHTLIGRITHQLSERWDQVNLTKYFPTNNLFRSKNVTNPSGKQ